MGRKNAGKDHGRERQLTCFLLPWIFTFFLTWQHAFYCNLFLRPYPSLSLSTPSLSRSLPLSISWPPSVSLYVSIHLTFFVAAKASTHTAVASVNTPECIGNSIYICADRVCVRTAWAHSVCVGLARSDMCVCVCVCVCVCACGERYGLCVCVKQCQGVLNIGVIFTWTHR